MNDRKKYINPWLWALTQYEAFLRDPQKIEFYLNNEGNVLDKKRFHALFLSCVRHQILTSTVMKYLISKTPRPKLRAVIALVLSEYMDADPVDAPKIGHHAVEMAKKYLSKPEAGLVNAVYRKAILLIEEFKKTASKGDVDAMSAFYSHPQWLVRKWLTYWGQEKVLALLKWNQTPTCTYFRLRNKELSEDESFPGTVSPWPGFYRFERGDWAWMLSALKTGSIYVQDPATRIAPNSLSVNPGDTVLDLCAAPGGKSLILADALSGDAKSCLVTVDRPNHRLRRLQENLDKVKNVKTHCLGVDICELTPSFLNEHGCPEMFDAVLLDAPCSNTGVLKRKPDVKLRLQESDIKEMASIQLKLLSKAAEFVKKGGRLVYSTCSLEPEENKGVVGVFLDKNHGAFELVQEEQSLPVDTGHDGAGVFLMRKL